MVYNSVSNSIYNNNHHLYTVSILLKVVSLAIMSIVLPSAFTFGSDFGQELPLGQQIEHDGCPGSKLKCSMRVGEYSSLVTNGYDNFSLSTGTEPISTDKFH